MLENEGFRYTKDSRQLCTSHDANERYWIWKLETLVPQVLNVADNFHSQNRSSRKKDHDFSLLFDYYICMWIYICAYMFMWMCMYTYACEYMKLPSILLHRLFSLRSLLRSFYSGLPALLIVFPHN